MGTQPFSWDYDPYGGGTVEEYEAVCPDTDPRCKVRALEFLERIRFLRLVDSLGTLGQSCQYAKVWTTDIWTRGKVWAYDYDDGQWADVHFSGVNDPMARLHIWAGHWAYGTREFLRTFVHEAAHAYFGWGETTSEQEALRCVP